MEKITPFITSIWMESINYDPKILDFILDIKSNTPTVKKSNRGGWQSDIFFKEDNDYVLSLLTEIKCLVENVYDELGISSSPKIKNYWFNCNNKNDFNFPHTHPYSFVSAVYYFKAPQNSGNIVFRRPDNFEKYIENAFKDTIENYRIFYVTPEDNLLLIFPSYLEHFVEPSQTDDLRISMAVNFG